MTFEKPLRTGAGEVGGRLVAKGTNLGMGEGVRGLEFQCTTSRPPGRVEGLDIEFNQQWPMIDVYVTESL